MDLSREASAPTDILAPMLIDLSIPTPASMDLLAPMSIDLSIPTPAPMLIDLSKERPNCLAILNFFSTERLASAETDLERESFLSTERDLSKETPALALICFWITKLASNSAIFSVAAPTT